MLKEPYAELERAELLSLQTLEDNDPTFPGRRLMLPGGTPHSIPEGAEANSFFEIPEFFFMSGAGTIRKRGDELDPLSPRCASLAHCVVK